MDQRRSERLTRQEEIKIFEEIESLEKELAVLYAGTFAPYELICQLRRKIRRGEITLEELVRDPQEYLGKEGKSKSELYESLLNLENCLNPEGRIAYDVDYAKELGERLYDLRLRTTHFAAMTRAVKDTLDLLKTNVEIIGGDFRKMRFDLVNSPEASIAFCLRALLISSERRNQVQGSEFHPGGEAEERWVLEVLGCRQRREDLEQRALATVRSLSSTYNLIRKRTIRLAFVRKRLIFPCLSLVNMEAKLCEPNGFQFWDLIRVGTEGLIEAAESFYPKRCHNFTALAHHFIRNAIFRAIDNGDLVPNPSDLEEEENSEDDW
jgi:hypothetical protein